MQKNQNLQRHNSVYRRVIFTEYIYATYQQ
jgi:hypothetical protein